MALKRKQGASLKPTPTPRQPADWKASLRYAMSFLLLITVVGAGAYLHHEDTLPVKHVTVEGDFRFTNKDALVKAVSPIVRGSFMDVDVASIRQAGEVLPWVKQIQVRRVWPDTLHLIVEEHKAIARWNDDGLVNTSGAVFKPAKETFPQGLVQLNGPTGTSELMARRLVDVQAQVAGLDLKVKQMDMDKRRAWQLHFVNEMQLKLGRADSDVRLQRFIEVYSGGLSQYQSFIAAVDMRYTNGLAVVWKQGQQPDFNGTV